MLGTQDALAEQAGALCTAMRVPGMLRSLDTLASLQCRVPNVQSAIRPRPVIAAIRLNPQPAICNNHFRRSELELPGPRNGLNL
eukprot:8165121-Alexandrium_andersonii.AAC.1